MVMEGTAETQLWCCWDQGADTQEAEKEREHTRVCVCVCVGAAVEAVQGHGRKGPGGRIGGQGINWETYGGWGEVGGG